MALRTPSLYQALRTVIFKQFQEEMAKAQPWSDRLWTKVPSTTKLNTYGWLAALPAFREWVGQRIVKGLSERLYQIINKDYELTVGIDRNDLDDSGGAVTAAMVTAGMGEEAKLIPDDLMVDLLQNGQTRVGYDGQYFFDTDHPINIDSVTGTQQNYWASGMALNAANFNTVLSAAMLVKGESGRIINRKGGWLLVVPPQLRSAGQAIVGLATLSGGGANPDYGAAELMVVPQLGNQPTTWYLINNDGAIKAFILQERQAPQMQSKNNPEDENMFWHKEAIFGADARYGAGYGVWFKAFKAAA